MLEGRSRLAIFGAMGLFAVAAAALVGCRPYWSASDSGGKEATLVSDVKNSRPASAAAEVEAASDLLEEAERNYLWEIEHHVNILMDVAFKRAAKGLAKADANELTAMLTKDFSGELPGETKPVSLDTEIVHFQRLRLDDGPAITADAEKFVSFLLGYRALYHQEPKAKLSIMGLVPVEGRKGLSGLWKGTCLLRMSGEADPGQPTEVSIQFEFIVPQPTEELSKSGRWLKSCKVLQAQVSHSSRFLLRLAGEERGIDVKRWWDNWKLEDQQHLITDTGSVNVCDFNRDGCMDMLVTDVTGIALYQGSPSGKFTEVLESLGLLSVPAKASVLALFVDLDGDGWEDLLLDNFLFRNEQGKKFTFVTLCTNIGKLPAAFNVTTADYNLDGKMDLYFTVGGVPKADSWIEGKSGRSHGNQLLMNMGNWEFKDVTKEANAEGGFRSVFTAAWFDANSDGWPDVHIPNEFGNGVLLVNQGNGTFREHDLTQGPSDFGTMGLTVGDVNNDGNIDIYCANMYSKAGNRVIGNLRGDAYPEHIMNLMYTYTKGSQLYRNTGNLLFERVGAKFQVADVGWAYGPCLADLDNDGFLDLHATAGFISVDPDEPDG